MSWTTRASANILPLSIEKGVLEGALKEWRYFGTCYTLNSQTGTCELCDQTGLTYHFEIANVPNGNELLIGSECINRFGIAGVDEHGRRLSADETRKKVGHDRRVLIDDARKKRLMTALVALAYVDKEFNINSFIEDIVERDAFTPKQLALILWRLGKNHIVHNRADFKLTIRRDREKRQLAEMYDKSDWRYQYIQASLSQTQKDWLAQRQARLNEV